MVEYLSHYKKEGGKMPEGNQEELFEESTAKKRTSALTKKLVIAFFIVFLIVTCIRVFNSTILIFFPGHH